MKTKILCNRILIILTISIFAATAVYSQGDKKKVINIRSKDGKVILDTSFKASEDGFILTEELIKNLELSKEDYESLREKLQNFKINVAKGTDMYISDIDDNKTITIWSTSVDKQDSTIRLLIKKCQDSDESYTFSIMESDEDGEDKGVYVVTTAGSKFDIKKDNGKSIVMKSVGKDGDSSSSVYVASHSGDGEHKKINIYSSAKGEVVTSGKTYAMVFSDDDGEMIQITCFTNDDMEEEDIETLKDAGIEWKKNELEPDDMMFFPNPNNGEFNLKFELEEEGDVEIKIIDFNGKVIYKEKLKNFLGKYEKKIDIKDQPNGTYFLNIQQNGKMSTSKVLITS